MSIIEQAPAVAAYTVDQFCAAHNICRTRLYALWGEGRGPRCGVDVFAAGLTPTIQFDARAGKEKPGTVSSGTGQIGKIAMNQITDRVSCCKLPRRGRTTALPNMRTQI